ncbi:MAG: zonular occludens toxin domain-containing protein [Desulfuromonadaceae bacterium]|jgi:zona occludens toxin (predicted ATPase)|nr:zonular occludens toxin domain-containing protein [Desulfuromonadaceae bacterium]
MPLKHITGVPGTGKTYFAIRDVILRYYKWDSDHVEWQLDIEKQKKPVIIYTNIEGLKLPHVNIDDYCRDNNIDIYRFFTTDYWENSVNYTDNQIVVILDEAQKYYPSNFRLNGTPAPEKNTLFWFQYHRHYGVDVYVITQTYDAICKHVVQLAEYEIHAITLVYSLGSQFRYVYRTGLGPDAIVDKKSFKYDKRVGMLYRSFHSESDDSARPNPMKRYLIITAFLTFSVFFGFIYFIGTFGHPDSPTEQTDAPARRVRDERGSGAAGTSGPPSSTCTTAPQPPPEPVAIVPERQIAVSTGGVWLGSTLYAIEWYGEVIPVRDFQFGWWEDKVRGKIIVQLPESLLRDIQIAKNGRYWQDSETGQWQDIEQPTTTDAADLTADTGDTSRRGVNWSAKPDQIKRDIALDERRSPLSHTVVRRSERNTE